MARPDSVQLAAGPRKALFTEQALDRFITQVMGMADPDEVLRKVGKTRASLRVLESSDEVSAALDTRREELLATPWRLEPGTGAAAAFVWEVIAEHMDAILRGAFNGVPYGYSVIEAVYARDGGRVVFEKVEEKPFEWFRPMGGSRLLYRPATDPRGVEVDTDSKFFATIRQQTYRNPYGEALLSRVYWPWFFREQGWRFWMSWLERFGQPWVIGYTTGDATVFRDALVEAVQSATIAGKKDADEINIVEQTGGSAHFVEFDRAVSQRIQKVILGQTLTTNVDGKGSYAAADVHDRVRMLRRNADIRLVSATVQRIVEALLRLNGMDSAPLTFIMEDDTGLETERAERDAKLYQAGVRFTEQYLLAKYDFEEGDFTLSSDAALPISPSAAPKKAAAFAADGPQFTPAQEALERQVDAALAASGPPLVRTEAIHAAIREARDAADLEARLSVLLRGADVETFRRIFSQCLFAADVLGFVQASEATR